MKEKHVFGVIGAGMIAREHIKNLALFDNSEVKWLCTRKGSEEKLEQLRKEFNIPESGTNYKEMLDDPEVDSVIICTPPFLHKEMFINALRKGKHILLEKPATTSLSDLEEMLEEASKYPELKICDCSCRHARLQPKFRFIRDIIESGELGKVYYIHHNEGYRQGRAGIEYHPTAKWFLNSKISGGGLVIDWGVYDLSFHLGILGDQPELIEVKTFLAGKLDDKDPGTDTYDTEEHAIVMMQYTGNLKYYWERASHSNVEVPNETRIYGTRGGIKLSYLSWNSPEIEVYRLNKNNQAVSEKITLEMDAHPGDGYMLIKHYLDVLDGKEEAAMPIELAAKHMRIIFKTYEQAEKITKFP